MVNSLLKNAWRLFKPILLLNGLFTFISLNWLHVAGFEKSRAYSVAIFIKISGYGLSLLIEWIFINKHRYFLKNQAFSNQRFFGILFSLDFMCFILLACLLWMAKVYI